MTATELVAFQEAVKSLVRGLGDVCAMLNRMQPTEQAPSAEYLLGYSSAVLRAARKRAEREYRTTIDDCGDTRQAWHNAMGALWSEPNCEHTFEANPGRYDEGGAELPQTGDAMNEKQALELMRALFVIDRRLAAMPEDAQAEHESARPAPSHKLVEAADELRAHLGEHRHPENAPWTLAEGVCVLCNLIVHYDSARSSLPAAKKETQ